MPLTKGSQPMKPTSGFSRARREQMLAAAEADLQPDARDRPRKQRAQVGEVAGAGSTASARQQRLEQAGLRGAQRLALAAAEEGAVARSAAPVMRLAPQAATACLSAVDEVGLLPGEAAVRVRLAAEMAVGRGRGVDRLVEVEVLADAARRQVHDLLSASSSLASSTWPVPCRST